MNSATPLKQIEMNDNILMDEVLVCENQLVDEVICLKFDICRSHHYLMAHRISENTPHQLQPQPQPLRSTQSMKIVKSKQIASDT